MTKKKNTDDANTITSVEATKAIADACLNPIIPIIEMQLMPVKEFLTDFAKAMSDSMTELKHHTTSLEKYSTTTIDESTTNETQHLYQKPSFIPRSARIKLNLKNSSTLANDTGIKGLKKGWNYVKGILSKKLLALKSKLKTPKKICIKTFLTYNLQITDALIIFEKLDTPLVTELNEVQFSICTTLIFLRRMKLVVPQPGNSYIYQECLKMDYQEVKEILLKKYISHEAIESE
jgi:hypothetical protein